jgi:RNA polymerase sigma-70 factor (ECF subfamily)
MRKALEKADSPEAKTPQPTGADSLPAEAPPSSAEAPRVPLELPAARRGDPEALERLLAGARPRLYALALRVLADPDEAEDAVQDAMVKVWKNLERFEGRAAFSTWLHRIGVNAALDRRRRRAVAPAVELEESRETSEPIAQAAPETPERQYARAEASFVVRCAMDRLSPAHGEALRLCDLEGDSYAEIADATACPIGTVMSRLYHARRNLVRELAVDARGEGDLDALRAA